MRALLPTVALGGLAALVCWAPLPANWEGPTAIRVLELRCSLLLSPEENRSRIAERRYLLADWERSLMDCEWVLARNPNHWDALGLRNELRMLLHFFEVSPRKGCPQCDVTDRAATQYLVEIDRAQRRAEWDRGLQDWDAAIGGIRKVREFLKWMPSNAEFHSRVLQATCLLEKIENERDRITSGSTGD